MKKWMISLLSVLAFTLAFSGCGGSEGGSSAGNDVEQPTNSNPPADNNGGDGNGGDDGNVDTSLVAVKNTIESTFGAVPANPGQTN